MSGGNSAQSAFVSFDLSRLSRRLLIAAALVVVGLGLAAGIAALIVRSAPGPSPRVLEAAAEHPALPILPDAAPDAPAPANPSPAQRPAQRPTPPAPVSLAEDEPPQHIAPPQPKPVVLPPLKDAPLPPPRPVEHAGPGVSPSGPFEQGTAVYVLTAHTVYMPDGTRLEAHSGLGELLDDPRHVDEKDRGATPPHLYDLTMREGLFHGVQALRLNPVGGENAIFGRAGLLAHPYMLGPTGDSNGCVSFKDYDAFLQAFENGKVKRLVVVASLN